MAAGIWRSLVAYARVYGDRFDVVGENTTRGDVAAQEPDHSEPVAASGDRGRTAVTSRSRGSPLLGAPLDRPGPPSASGHRLS